ncbi:MAG: alkaline phosphatase family protein [Actinomycetota bacterium]
MAAEPIRPAYEGACVSRIVPAVLGEADRSWLPRTARDARSVLLLLIDGLGWKIIERNRDRLPVISSLEGGSITTVVPSTTPSVLTSISTSLTPAEHGVVGFRMKIGGGILNTLAWAMENGDEPPDPQSVQPHPAFGGRQISVITKSEFRGGGFTRAHLGGARFDGYAVVSMLVERARRLIGKGEELVYAYYAGIDLIAHLRGLDDGFFAAELAFVDRLVGDFLDALPRDAAVLVTADHGQVPLSRDSWFSLEELSDDVDCYSGDARLRFVHTREGAGEAVAAAAEELFGESAWVFTRERFLDEGWLGPAPKPEVVGRVGDVVLAARAPVAFIDPALPQEVRLRTGHGSMTEEEMLVPLLAGRGRA